MKSRMIWIATAFAALLMVETGFAQTTGTASVTGTNPTAVSITNTGGGSLSTTVALGTLTPASGGTLALGTFDVQMRSNKAYVLSAQASALAVTGAGSDDGGSAIALTDIGFGITTLTNTGANVATGRTDTKVAKFDVTGGWPAVTNGLSPFVAGTNGTLNDITSNTQILSGNRISAKGNISTNNNYIAATLGVAVLPQYFTPNTNFSTTITLTVTAP